MDSMKPKDDKIIICVGRQVGSGGREIAKLLAEDLNCGFNDKEILDLAAKESGLDEKFFEHNDENMRPFRSLLHFCPPFFAGITDTSSSLTQENLYKFQSDVICRVAQEGSCVFVGRTADYILRDMKGMVSVFITDSLENRIRRVSQRHNLTPEQAERYIKEKEATRSSFYGFYSGKKWGSSESYDLCLNSGLLGIEGTERFIADFVSRVGAKAKEAKA